MLEASGRRAVQRVGLVRFNPFEDTGGNQSFALAMTDANGDGVVVSSLHARAGTRVYGKAVVAGRSDAALSDEEAEALRLALATTPPSGSPAAAEQASGVADSQGVTGRRDDRVMATGSPRHLGRHEPLAQPPASPRRSSRSRSGMGSSRTRRPNPSAAIRRPAWTRSSAG